MDCTLRLPVRPITRAVLEVAIRRNNHVAAEQTHMQSSIYIPFGRSSRFCITYRMGAVGIAGTPGKSAVQYGSVSWRIELAIHVLTRIPV